MANILILEDSPESFEIARRAIGVTHKVKWAKCIHEAKELFQDSLDLLLVDVSLPDGDGFEFCSWVRGCSSNNDVPILFVSAKNNVESCVTGLMAGGDDYIYKPFHLAEFRARVEARLRSVEPKRIKNLCIESNGLKVDLRARKAYLKQAEDDVELDLTPIEFKILQLFLEEPGKACHRDEILNRVWGQSIYVYPRSVDTHVSKLRKKLGPMSCLIHSVHGTGYRFSDSSKAG